MVGVVAEAPVMRKLRSRFGRFRRPDKALVARMDRLREKIGPIGVSVAKLVREGRRRRRGPEA